MNQPRPTTSLTELHDLCRADYAKGQSQRATAHLAPPAPACEPSDLAVAIRVGQRMLATFGDSSRDGFSYPEACGALRESLRLLLRALDPEPTTRSEGWTDVMTGQVPGDDEPDRCPAAHPEDPTPCGGPVVVTVLDATNAGANGCEHHGTRLLASLDRGRVYALPDAPAGTAIRVFKAADGIRPFPWVDSPRTRDDQLSRAETRGRGERP